MTKAGDDLLASVAADRVRGRILSCPCQYVRQLLQEVDRKK